MTKVAPTLGISDVGLAKVCRKYKIPRPLVGFWEVTNSITPDSLVLE